MPDDTSRILRILEKLEAAFPPPRDPDLPFAMPIPDDYFASGSDAVVCGTCVARCPYENQYRLRECDSYQADPHLVAETSAEDVI